MAKSAWDNSRQQSSCILHMCYYHIIFYKQNSRKFKEEFNTFMYWRSDIGGIFFLRETQQKKKSIKVWRCQNKRRGGRMRLRFPGICRLLMRCSSWPFARSSQKDFLAERTFPCPIFIIFLKSYPPLHSTSEYIVFRILSEKFQC